MTRVLFFNYSNEIGGAEQSLLDLLKGLHKRGFELSLLTFGRGPLADRAHKLGVEVIEAPEGVDLSFFRRDFLGLRLFWALPKIPAIVRQLWMVRRAVKHRTVAIVHTNNPKSHVLGALATLWLKCKIVFHMRDLFRKYSSSFWLFGALGFLRRPGAIAISRAVLDSLPRALRARGRVIYNGFQIPVIAKDRRRVRRELRIGEAEKVVITVGRIVPWKGHRELLTALAPALNTPGTRLLVVGDVYYWEKKYLAEVKSLARDLGIDAGVIFTGFQEDVNSLLSASDLFVTASLDEPFGRVLVEAMLCELPVVAFDCGGPREIVENNRTGLLVRPGDTEKLSAAVQYLLSDPEKRLAMGRAARGRALTRFPIETSLRSVAGLYEEMLREAP